MEDITRIPPHSVESEQSILGSILLDKDAMITVSEIVNPDDFYKEAHKIIYESMIKLSNKSEPIDLITLTEELKKQGHLDDVGGISYITSLSTIVPTTSNVRYYADIVKEKSVLRKLIKASNDIINLGYDGANKIEDVLDKAEKKIFDISQEKTSDDFKSINSVLIDAYDMIEHLYTNKSEITGITTGFRDLNKKINGMQRTDLLLIAARPAMGKTAFSLNLVQNAALKGDASVAVFSLEMSKEQLVQRMLSAQSNVELNKLKTGKLNENDWPRIIDAMAVLSNVNIYIDDTPRVSVDYIVENAKRQVIDKSIDGVFIDMMALIRQECDSWELHIQQLISKLTALAEELNIVVIGSLRVNRNLRIDGYRNMTDLKDLIYIESSPRDRTRLKVEYYVNMTLFSEALTLVSGKKS